MRAEGSVQLAGSALRPAKCIGPSRKESAQDDKYGDAGEIQYSKLSTRNLKLSYTLLHRSARGSSGFNLASSRSSSFVRSSWGMGTWTVISTISSPRAPSLVAEGTPFSRRRNFCPD